ncbi:MAG TPA: fibronectin type III domain-containing protein, partial [Opitutaceae bacterium]|nr:fibronectin type III domain-containing protein [Opitutaceae bacterium]
MPSLPRHRLGANDWPHFPYTNGAIDLNDDWGSQTMHEIGKPPQPLDQFNIYNISSESSEWTCRLNGLPLFQTASNSVYFRSDPLLGHNTDDWFLGDIAEVIVYDHVLNDAERMTVGAYLGSKYKLYQPLPVPTNLTATPLSPHQVSLQWTAPARGDHVNYVVERSDGAHSVQIAVPDSLSYIDSGLTPGTIYTYQVQAQGYAGVSAPTSPITVTTLLDGGGTDVPLASTRLWLKADAGISVGTGVNLWVDQSQYGNNATQIVTSNQPQLVTSATDSTLPNNEPVVRFNGTSSYLTLPNFMSGSATNAGEVFMVVRAPLTPAATWRGVWRMGA